MDTRRSTSRTQPPKAAYAYDRQPDQAKTNPPTLRSRVSASSLLSLFKARSSPSSVSVMERKQRDSKPMAYVELDDSDDEVQVVKQTPGLQPPGFPLSEGPRKQNPEEQSDSANAQDPESDDRILSNMNVVPSTANPATRTPTQTSHTPSRNVLTRSARSGVSYSTPKTPKQDSPSKYSKAGKKKLQSQQRILESDTMVIPFEVKQSRNAHVKIKPDTARTRVRDEIATKTKAKQDAYLLHHKEHFLPLLPKINYITKLAQSRGQVRTIVPHQQLSTQPENITATLKPYQLTGLSFLATMYENGMSAILGDEMGLGKTLQTLSLIQYLEETYPSPSGISRPYLVVCPLSVLESWYNECRKWTPNLRPMRFHGNASERDSLKARAMGKIDRFGNETAQTKRKRSNARNTPATGRGRQAEEEDTAGFDILITTYEIFVSEQTWFKHAFVWRYIILDEGHKIKNEKSNVSHALQGLKAEHRLLLTGTPMQNNLREMWALLHWLFPDVFTDKTADVFSEAFDLGKGKVSTTFMDHARRLLELVMIRRLKDSPGVNLGLPPKYEVLLYVPLTPIQRFWYTRLLTKAGGTLIDDLFKGMKNKEQQALKAEQLDDKGLAQLENAVDSADHGTDHWAESRQIIQQAIENDAETGEKDTSAYKKLLNLVMQLRKCCVHPYQIKGAAPDPYVLGDHIMHASGKFVVLSKLVDELIVKQKKKILIFSGFTHTLDYCEDLLCHKGASMHNAPFRYLRLDGDSARAKRNLDIRLFNDQSSEFKVMLISTRAGGLGLNLTAATEIIFLDEDWNPQVTLQAEARAHRIGQTKPVTIYKICTQGTVEEQMMGRIRKKLYLSAKITESMRDIYSTAEPSHKRKRLESTVATPTEDNVPQLGMGQLMSLIRRGASTLAHPEIDVDEMISWDFATLIDKCKDRPIDPHVAEVGNEAAAVNEQEWLAKMERVETAVLDGVKYQRQADAGQVIPVELSRSDRRVGKNTTVMVDGFAINKESLQCADWEAVPTMAGKDPRLASPKKEKAPPIQHQDYCQVCHDGGEVLICAGCPRVYHPDCLSEQFQEKAERVTGFHCPQHQCFDCDKTTSNAGGLIYRCRWCDKGFCEDCLDWDTAKLLGGTLPEFDMLQYTSRNAWYVECQHCIDVESTDPDTKVYLAGERTRIEQEHKQYLADADAEAAAAATVIELQRQQAIDAEVLRQKIVAEEKLVFKRESDTAVARALFAPCTTADESMTEAPTLSSYGGATTPQDDGLASSLSARPSKRRKIAVSTTSKETNLQHHHEHPFIAQAEAGITSASTGSGSDDETHPATSNGFLRRAGGERSARTSSGTEGKKRSTGRLVNIGALQVDGVDERGQDGDANMGDASDSGDEIVSVVGEKARSRLGRLFGRSR